MQNISYSLCLVLIMSFTAGTALSQEIRYDGPNEANAFFPIGFSGDGSLFAYGWFETTGMISNGSAITIKVQNLVTDNVLYEKKKDWDEGNVGPEDAGYYPKDAEKAWELVAGEVNKKFVQLDIWGGAGAGVLPFPLGDLGLYVEIREFEGEPGYGVYAVSEELGEKMISSSGNSYIEEISVEGFVWNPEGTRIGVIMHEISGAPYSTYWVIGCHVSSGFRKAGE